MTTQKYDFTKGEIIQHLPDRLWPADSPNSTLVTLTTESGDIKQLEFVVTDNHVLYVPTETNCIITDTESMFKLGGDNFMDLVIFNKLDIYNLTHLAKEDRLFVYQQLAASGVIFIPLSDCFMWVSHPKYKGCNFWHFDTYTVVEMDFNSTIDKELILKVKTPSRIAKYQEIDIEKFYIEGGNKRVTVP